MFIRKRIFVGNWNFHFYLHAFQIRGDIARVATIKSFWRVTIPCSIAWVAIRLLSYLIRKLINSFKLNFICLQYWSSYYNKFHSKNSLHSYYIHNSFLYYKKDQLYHRMLYKLDHTSLFPLFNYDFLFNK